jgi:subtilisin family serine protease
VDTSPPAANGRIVVNAIKGVGMTALLLSQWCSRSRWRFLAGCIASDGHVSKKTQQYCVKFSNSNPALHAVVNSLMYRLFGVQAGTRKPKPGATCYDNEFDNKDAWLTLVAIGIPAGKKSKLLRFPELIAKSPRSVIAAFLAGLIEGDGNVADSYAEADAAVTDDTGRLRISTGSETFAEDIVGLCQTLGFRASYAAVPPSATALVQTTEPSFSIRLACDAEIIAALRIKSAARHPKPMRRISSKIVTISRKHYAGELFDLTVDRYHNYVANGHIVSNTWVTGCVVAAANDVGVRGLAYQAKALVGKVLGDQGSGSDANIMRGLGWAYQKGADIYSLSLGGPAMSEQLHSLFREVSQQKGKFIFCASGNDAGPVNFPSAWAEVISVGAVDQTGHLTPFTSRGPELDILAPGVELLSTIPGNRYGTLTGTSMATPIAAGIGGLIYAEAVNSGRGSELDSLDKMLMLLRKTGRSIDGSTYPLIDPRTLATQFVTQPNPLVTPLAAGQGPDKVVVLYANGDAFMFGRSV